MGFSLSLPVTQHFEANQTTVEQAYIRAVNRFALDTLIPDLVAAARTVGASPDLRADIGLYGEHGALEAGIPADSPSAREAYALEYGTAVGAPKGWMRGTLARGQARYDRAFSNELTQELFGG